MISMFFLRFFLFFAVLSVFGHPVWGQVRLFQWTDVHSTLQSISRQVLAMDLMAQEFKAKNPGGEVVVYIIGDFTSPNI